jgi:hypothetical protein
MQHSMNANASQLKDNPLAGFAQELGNLVMNAFRPSPGTGLYILATCVVIATVASHTRVLSMIRLVGQHE